MTILGGALSDSPGRNAKHSPRTDPRPWPLSACPQPVRVTIRFDHDVPSLCRHHPPGTPDEPIPRVLGTHRHRRQTSSRPGMVLGSAQRWRVTPRFVGVLAVLLGGVAAITVGVLGGIGAAVLLLPANLIGTLIQHRRGSAAAGGAG